MLTPRFDLACRADQGPSDRLVVSELYSISVLPPWRLRGPRTRSIRYPCARASSYPRSKAVAHPNFETTTCQSSFTHARPASNDPRNITFESYDPSITSLSSTNPLPPACRITRSCPSRADFCHRAPGLVAADFSAWSCSGSYLGSHAVAVEGQGLASSVFSEWATSPGRDEVRGKGSERERVVREKGREPGGGVDQKGRE